MISPRANITAYICHLNNNFSLGFCHKDKSVKTEFQQNIRRKADVQAAILLTV